MAALAMLAPEHRGPEEDPDGDGVGNLLEYALATLPWKPDVSTPRLAIADGRAEITFFRAERLLDLVYEVQTNSMLASNDWIANTTYLADHGVYCPADDRSNNRRWHGSRSSSGGRFDPTLGFLSPYLGRSMQVNTCPLFRAMVEGSSSFEDGTGGMVTMPPTSAACRVALTTA